MCGICGMVNWDGSEVNADLLTAMRDLMVSRGPDDKGLHTEPHVGLGHRRLSIIDLSRDGHQPMANEDETVWLVFNGEIYNFMDLRGTLVDAGHQFRSRTDTEVLVHGYEEWGIDGLADRIKGMFAVAIWDRAKQVLHLLRDHVGKKPLFYRYHRDRLVFGSDIKCIWLSAGRSLAIDETALDEYLYYYFITQHRSIFRGVMKLPPGHRATVSQAGVSLRRFWTPDFSHKEQRSPDEWLDGIDHYLHQAVQRRLVSDVPLGAFLSGGVDSSAVCAVMADESASPPKTFSVGFDDAPAHDEREHARAVARHIGAEHTELIAASDVFARLPAIVWQYGEPFGDSSAVPTYLIAEAARKHVSVVLTGDGGDEAFAGYDRHICAGRDQRWPWMPDVLRCRVLPRIAEHVTGVLPGSLLAQRVATAAGYWAGTRDALAGNICWWDGLRAQLYTDEWRSRLGDWHPLTAQQQLLGELNGPTQVDRALQYVLTTRMPSDYLAKVDVATMAHSLEARSPFLDVDLLEFAATIPADLLIEGRIGKALLKRYAARLVPRDVIYRPKQGFALPLGDWLRTRYGELLKRVLLSSPACDRGHFRMETVRAVLDQHICGQADHTHRLWTLLVFEIWNRLFVDGSLNPTEPLSAMAL
jgi:asparagine synthase (glutamine-hydrolysing)